jgi:uncharacterized repeat protein (TIGR03987 family)
MLTKAIISVSLALVLFTVNMFFQIKSKEVKVSNLIHIGVGLVANVIGVNYMSQLSTSSYLTLHGMVGIVGILVMVVYFLGSAFMVIKKTVAAKFHVKTIIAYVVWLVPFVLGIAIA